MSLERIHKALGWPSPEEVWRPSGSGPRVYAALAERKIGDALRRLEARDDIRVGVLTADSTANSTEQPIAIVCEFKAPATSAALREAHRLAWNFSRAPLLITLEPHLIRTWTCCEPPSSEPSLYGPAAEISEVQLNPQSTTSLSSQAAHSLHWLELVTGNFFRQHEDRFKRGGCADRLLLDNLKAVRQRLLRQGLSDDTSHDLLARLIFIQFLFDRKDSSGTAALNAAKLRTLHRDGVLAAPHADLASLLGSYEDTYAMFRWLDTIFNGDLFPGKSETQSQRDAEWRREMEEVKPRHLQTIADFVSGRVAMQSGQRLLWPEYSFDAIPLEFISSIYEEFVTKVKKKKAGAVYTPPHVVDFMLDEVLPWESTDWDIRVLDPACGSGIFLVRAFQRLIYRWRLGHPKQDLRPADLRTLLERNLFGVDIDPHAVRVASFSLYLAMCDEIDPKHYWTQVRFPRLRGNTLVCADFFAEDIDGFRTQQDAGRFDIIVGNAPWGQNTIGKSNIARWKKAGWPTVYNSIGPVFLAKGAALLKPRGRLSMLQPAGLILNDVGTASVFRRKLFETVAVETVVNLAALRFALFPNAVGPACIVTFRNEAPSNEEVIYICPKPAASTENDYRIIVEPYDVNTVPRREALGDTLWWTAMMWGGRRDVALVESLGQLSCLNRVATGIRICEGIIRGNEERSETRLVGRRILEQPAFPDNTWLRLRAAALPRNQNPRANRPRDLAAFELPQLLVKQSWTVEKGRFEAVIVDGDMRTGGVICTQSYITVHVPPEKKTLLEAACLACNSVLAVYFLFLTSSRLASYRPEPLVNDWLRIPIPRPSPGILAGLRDPADVDRRMFELLELSSSERALIEDTVKVTLADFKGDSSSPGRQTTRGARRSESTLTRYCKQFMEVLHAAFGRGKHVRATIFQEGNGNELPVRLVALHLNWPGEGGIVTEAIDSEALRERLRVVGEGLSRHRAQTGFQRIARIYDSITVADQIVPTVYLIKPDRVSYWTRSMALRDADEVSAEFLLCSDASGAPAEGERHLA